MATIRWTGRAQAVAQSNLVTIGGAAANAQVYTLTINGKTVTYTATGTDTNATITTALLAALQLSTIPPEFQEISWAAGSTTTTITGTARTPGKPFTCTTAATGTGTLVSSVLSLNSGPNVIDLAANWSTGAVPVNGDDVVLEASNVSLLYDLGNLSSVTLASLTINASFTGAIGLPETNTDSTAYLEYRAQYWQIKATLVTVGLGGAGQGSGRIKVDNGTAQTLWDVWGTGSPLIDGQTTLEAILWKGTHAANVINVYQGSFAAAGYGGESATIATLRIGYNQSQASDAAVRCGPGCTLTTIVQDGGALQLNSAVTTITKTTGVLLVNGTGAVTTLTDHGGTTFWRTSGTLTTANLNAATLTMAGDPRLHTVTTANLYTGAQFLDPEQTLATGTNFIWIGCGMADTTLNLGNARMLTLAA